MSRQRYAIVGLGGRSRMYYKALTETYKDTSEIVALCDVNQTRMDYANRKIEDIFGDPPEDKFKRAASHVDGAMSILTGIAANKSFGTGMPVTVDELVRF